MYINPTKLRENPTIKTYSEAIFAGVINICCNIGIILKKTRLVTITLIIENSMILFVKAGSLIEILIILRMILPLCDV